MNVQNILSLSADLFHYVVRKVVEGSTVILGVSESLLAVCT